MFVKDGNYLRKYLPVDTSCRLKNVKFVHFWVLKIRALRGNYTPCRFRFILWAVHMGFVVEKWHWAVFVYDLVVLFVSYHSTTAVFLFILICSNIRQGCPDTISAHCDSKEKVDPFHNSLRESIKTRYRPQSWSLSQHRMKTGTFLLHPDVAPSDMLFTRTCQPPCSLPHWVCLEEEHRNFSVWSES